VYHSFEVHFNPMHNFMYGYKCFSSSFVMHLESFFKWLVLKHACVVPKGSGFGFTFSVFKLHNNEASQCWQIQRFPKFWLVPITIITITTFTVNTKLKRCNAEMRWKMTRLSPLTQIPNCLRWVLWEQA
jgi:hypothetical protein